MADWYATPQDADHQFLILGGSDLEDAARAAGLTQPHRVGVPYGQSLLGLPAVLRQLRALEPIDRFDLWSLDALRLVQFVRPRVPRRLILTRMPSPRNVRLLLKLMRRDRHAPTAVVALSEPLRHALIDAGVSETALEVVEPAFNTTRIDPTQRAALRKRWRITDENMPVIMPLSDPPQIADTQIAAMTASLTQYVNDTRKRGPQPLALLVHPGQRFRSRAERMLRLIGQPVYVIQDAAVAAPWEVLPGCDVALAFGRSSSGLSLGWAMKAGLPIVAEPTAANRHLLADAPGVVFARSGRPKALSHEVNRILNTT